MRCGTRSLEQRGEEPSPSRCRPRDPRALPSPSDTRPPSPARLSRAPALPHPPPAPSPHLPMHRARAGGDGPTAGAALLLLLLLLHPSLRGSGAPSELPDSAGPALPTPGSAPVPAPPPPCSALTHRATALLGGDGGDRSCCPMGTAMRISGISRSPAQRCPQTEPGPRRGAALPRPSPAPPDGAAPAPPRPRAAPRPPRRRSPVGRGEQRAAARGGGAGCSGRVCVARSRREGRRGGGLSCRRVRSEAAGASPAPVITQRRGARPSVVLLSPEACCATNSLQKAKQREPGRGGSHVLLPVSSSQAGSCCS